MRRQFCKLNCFNKRRGRRRDVAVGGGVVGPLPVSVPFFKNSPSNWESVNELLPIGYERREKFRRSEDGYHVS